MITMTAWTRSCAISMDKAPRAHADGLAGGWAARFAVVDLSSAALGLVVLTVIIGLSVGFLFGVASALLAFVTGALLGAILLVWHSLRTLAGDADVDPALDLATSAAAPTALSERKRRALRALKDIEQEHSIGKLDDKDFATLDAEYRSQAKEVIREMDAALDPFREKAEALVRAHLEKRPKDTPVAAPPTTRNACPSCETINDDDATFCKKCGAKLTRESS